MFNFKKRKEALDKVEDFPSHKSTFECRINEDGMRLIARNLYGTMDGVDKFLSPKECLKLSRFIQYVYGDNEEIVMKECAALHKCEKCGWITRYSDHECDHNCCHICFPKYE